MTEMMFRRDQGEHFVRVLEEAGATGQEMARFVHLLKRSLEGAWTAITLIEAGTLGVAEAIDSCAEIARERGR